MPLTALSVTSCGELLAAASSSCSGAACAVSRELIWQLSGADSESCQGLSSLAITDAGAELCDMKEKPHTTLRFQQASKSVDNA